jgi:hypothetical protein
LLGTLTVASTGRWSLARRVTSTARFWAISHSQLSAVRTVTTQ